jgi:hypothetical protein
VKKLIASVLGIAIIAAIVAVSPGMGLAQSSSVPHEFRICTGDFALCAASTCTPNHNTIPVNGTTMTFDECEATCPIFTGPAIADSDWRKHEGKLPAATGHDLVVVSSEQPHPAGD